VAPVIASPSMGPRFASTSKPSAEGIDVEASDAGNYPIPG
jgi:hypothetical protein